MRSTPAPPSAPLPSAARPRGAASGTVAAIEGPYERKVNGYLAILAHVGWLVVTSPLRLIFRLQQYQNPPRVYRLHIRTQSNQTRVAEVEEHVVHRLPAPGDDITVWGRSVHGVIRVRRVYNQHTGEDIRL